MCLFFFSRETFFVGLVKSSGNDRREREEGEKVSWGGGGGLVREEELVTPVEVSAQEIGLD